MPMSELHMTRAYSTVVVLVIFVGHISLVPQFYLFGSRRVLPVQPTILMYGSVFVWCGLVW